MKTYDYLIIGNGIAGVTAAETIREHDSAVSIAIISDEPHHLYSRVLLPSYLKKRIPREKVFLRREADFPARGIELYLKEHVVSLDAAAKIITMASGLYLRYQKLLISSGGRVRNWEGGSGAGVYRFQTLDDADAIFTALRTMREPVVIGASFISLEFLEILEINKTLPTLLVRDAYFFNRLLDRNGGALLDENFKAKGIRVEYNDEVEEVNKYDGVFQIQTKKGNKIATNTLCLGIGIRRNTNFLDGSGVLFGESGIHTNEFLETSTADIFAAGDIAEYFDVVMGHNRTVGNWTNAFLQGKTAGLNMLGNAVPFKSVSVYSITNLGLHITALGETDDRLETISRVNPESKRYERFFMRDGVLKGAALINRFQDKLHLTRLIETRTPLGEFQKELGNISFDIQKIPIVN